ncbi:hypothetical protein [Snodgrassella alvi]|uniref:hypothetical protein n=1 Tax=Snodgrassella alvi TaxID=1196083 RepID=UPI000C1EF56F|nr:hypothetical protein [Snodgrassella alvi]PIT18267.1 hypothetical protein BGI33_01555 [Snodgrassella alvi]
MIEVTEKAEPEIKYPVGRQWKPDDEDEETTVAIFWNRFQGAILCGNSASGLVGRTAFLIPCDNYVKWLPVDFEISEGCIIFDGGKIVKEEIIYPVARRRKYDGLLVIYTAYKAGVVANVGRRGKPNKDTYVGSCARDYWDEAMKSTDSEWEPVNLKIYG